MIGKYKFLIAVYLTVFCIGCDSRQSNVSKENANKDQIAIADSILLYFQQEQFDKIEFHFDNKVKAQLSKEKLAVVWAQLNTQVGKYTSSKFYKAEKINAIGDRIMYECIFGNQKLYFQLLFGKENQIAGLFFVPNPK